MCIAKKKFLCARLKSFSRYITMFWKLFKNHSVLIHAFRPRLNCFMRRPGHVLFYVLITSIVLINSLTFNFVYWKKKFLAQDWNLFNIILSSSEKLYLKNHCVLINSFCSRLKSFLRQVMFCSVYPNNVHRLLNI